MDISVHGEDYGTAARNVRTHAFSVELHALHPVKFPSIRAPCKPMTARTACCITGRIGVGIIRSAVPSTMTLTLMVATLGAAPVRAEMAAADAATGTGGDALQEIVVTATKRSESLQNVGLSITALTTEQLESKGVEQFFDYGNSIPNLSFAIDSADGSLAARGIALRGIQGSNTTGFYIDDIPVLETLDPHIVDVARIEVLRGPQGTLYGAESMGGTVRIITAQPNAAAFSGQLHAGTSATEHGSMNGLVEGEVNLPLIDNTLALRASGFYQFDSGFFDKGLGPEDAPPTSVLHNLGSLEYYGGQVALRWEPVEGLSITPRVMYQQTVEDGVPYALGNADNLLQRQVFNIKEGGTDKWWRSAPLSPRPRTSIERRSKPRMTPTLRPMPSALPLRSPRPLRARSICGGSCRSCALRPPSPDPFRR
jgi:outer membrane receptor protein involved in Fe transport